MTVGLGVQLGSLAAAVSVVLALFKLRPEREGLIVSAAHDAVDSLAAALDELRKRVDESQADRARLANELVAARRRIAELEAEVARLRQIVGE